MAVMGSMDTLTNALEDFTTEQLEQLNRILSVARKYLPADGLTGAQMQQRTSVIVKAVSLIQDGTNDEALDGLIKELKQII
jgi:hypothetical protein